MLDFGCSGSPKNRPGSGGIADHEALAKGEETIEGDEEAGEGAIDGIPGGTVGGGDFGEGGIREGGEAVGMPAETERGIDGDEGNCRPDSTAML